MQSRGNVMVVDDENIVCQSCQRVLAEAGYNVTTMERGMDAIEQSTKEPFDLAFVDLMMPDIDGISVIGKLKANQPNLEVVVITGYPSLETIKESFRLGAGEYLSKPLNPDQIMKATLDSFSRKEWGINLEGRRNEPTKEYKPGDNQYWMSYEGSGLMKIGLDQYFLKSIGRVVYIEFPLEGTPIAKDTPLLKLLTLDGKVHDILSPVSGRLNRINDKFLTDPNILSDLPSFSHEWGVELNLRTAE